MRIPLVLLAALGAGCADTVSAETERWALAITHDQLVQKGFGSDDVPPDTLHLLVANYAIDCAAPWGNETVYVPGVKCSPERVYWDASIRLRPEEQEPGTVPTGAANSTVEAVLCGDHPESSVPEIVSGTLTLTQVLADAIHFGLAGTHALTDGNYVAERCPDPPK
jgi:hypothetical protein